MSERLPVWPVYRDCLRAWRRDFWYLTLLAGMILLPLLLVQYALYGAAGVSLSSDDSWSLWIVSIPVFVYAVESHHFMSALMEKLEGAERHGHEAPTLHALLSDLPWVRLFFADLLFTLVLVLGLLALVVPALILGTWFVLVMPLINLERQPVLATFRRSRRLVRGNFWRVLAVWAPVWLGTTAASEALGEMLEHLGHSHVVHIVSHLIPEMLLLPISALPAVILTFELLDREELRAPASPVTPVAAPTIPT